MHIQIIGIPTYSGTEFSSTEHAPAALRQAGLQEALQEKGLSVRDQGDLQLPVDLIRHNTPPLRNWPAPRLVWEAITEEAPRWFSDPAFTLVLGGDCSIVTGTVDSLCRLHGDNVYLLVVDGHVDMLDFLPHHCVGTAGMGLRFLTRENPFWEKPAAFSGEQITVVGHTWQPESGVEDFNLIPLEDLRGRGLAQTAEDVLKQLPADAVVLVHFDVDVICREDMPAAYEPSAIGLSLSECTQLLGALVADPRVIGMEVTEFSAVRDEDGTSAKRLVGLLSEVLANKKAVRA